MPKGYDQRVNDTIAFLRRSGLPNATLAADEIEDSYRGNIPYQRELGEAISVDSGKVSKDARKAIRALVLLNITQGRVELHRAADQVADYLEMDGRTITQHLRETLARCQFPPEIFDAEHWLLQSPFPNVGQFFQLQNEIQADFKGRTADIPDPTTRSVMEHALGRVGKLAWAANAPSVNAANKFKSWTRRDPDATENLQMNCWEGVLYCISRLGRSLRISVSTSTDGMATAIARRSLGCLACTELSRSMPRGAGVIF